ncbi:MAG: epoxide hydrolase [Actinomycetota bacterium]|nr:epoxide hydrolase [Actinomycetota bacterium]
MTVNRESRSAQPASSAARSGISPSPPPVIDASVLGDLCTRIGKFRLVDLPAAHGWSLGVDPAYLKDLLATWVDDYDWRVVEDRVRSLPWVVAGHPDTPIRAIQQRAATEDAATVVLLHGWPDSILRFEKVLPMLTDVHVVVPALPGYPFALPSVNPGMSAAAMATAVAAAMADLGYDHYVVSAGDVGTDVAEALAARHPEQVVGLHLTDLSHHHALNDPPADLSAAETAYLERVHRWHTAEGGYNHQQSTMPNTLAIGLGDSPAGLAAWIVDKLYRWSDCGGDLETVFTRGDVLNWITAYWVTGTIGTSFAPYADREPPPGAIDVPTAFTLFPADIVNAPREFTARFVNVQSWVEASGGGHFDAWERPADYVAGIRAALAHRRM